jgi:hypothetical protein
MLIIEFFVQKSEVPPFFHQYLVPMDPPDQNPTVEPPPVRKEKRDLTSSERRNIVSTLLLSVKPGDPDMKLLRGVIQSCADAYRVNRFTIRKVWQRALANYHNPNIQAFISSPQRKGACGRPRKWNRDDVREAVTNLALHQKRTIRSIATALEIPKSTVFRMKEDKNDMVIMPRSIAVKPLLTDVHKMQRVLFASSKISQPENHFHHFYDSIHVDEKWFFISEKQLRVYCAPDEEIPERNAQNRDHLLKVMFLCAVARPRFNAAGNCTFDGKIGMWPFVQQTVAQRRSVNRNRGDPVTKIINCDKATYRRFMIEKVIPAIRLKWPDRGMIRRLVIQHDGASAHITDNDVEFHQAARQGVWHISLEKQPAKSPDTNVLDLSFFRALQAKQWSLGSETTIDGLIAQVLRAFQEFDPRKIDCGFLTLQTCLNDMLEVHGGNDYKIRHLGKQSILRELGELPQTIAATAEAVQVKEMFTGDGGEISDIGDKDSDAGTVNGAVEQMIIAAV